MSACLILMMGFLLLSGGTSPRLLSVTVDVVSAMISVLWLNPLYNTLDADDNFYLSAIAVKVYRTEMLEEEV